MFDHINILSTSVLIFLPLLLAGIILLPCFPDNKVTIRRFAKTGAALLFLYSVLFWVEYDPSMGLMFIEEFKWPIVNKGWISTLGVNYIVGLDGLSLTLCTLTTFIVLLACVASKKNIRYRSKFYYSMVFLLTTGILGVFAAQDLFLFFMFWELELIPMYFLISIWGSGRAKYSAMKFVLYTLVGSIFMLCSILLLYYYYYTQTGVLTFDMQALWAFDTYPLSIQILCFIGFLIGFGVKLPIVPFHTWLPDAHVDAPTPISMILAGILLKLGGYGLLRFNVGFFPEALDLLAPLIAILAVINILYGAMIAVVQTDMKKLVAYSSVSHMGIVLLGIAAMNIVGISGAMMQMIAHGLISAGLFMCVGSIYLRTHTRSLEKLGGLGHQFPVISGFFLLLGLAGLGLPLLVGFAAESLTFYGAFLSSSFKTITIFTYTLPVSIQGLTIVAVFGIILAACYVLLLFKRVLFDQMFSQYRRKLDARFHEVFVLGLLSLCVIFFGCFPNTLTRQFEPTITNLVDAKYKNTNTLTKNISYEFLKSYKVLN